MSEQIDQITEKSNAVKNTTVKMPSQVEPRTNKTSFFSNAFIGLSVLALGFAGGWLGSVAQQNEPVTVTHQKTVLATQATLVSSVAKEVGESVVSVNVVSRASNGYSGSIFGYGLGSQTQESAGTGIILSEDGLILTNRHVVPVGTTEVSIVLSDGTVLDGVKVLGRTNSRDSLDIAFLKVEDTKGKKLVPAKIGDSSKVSVGDSVIAIGNALGQFQNTVTTGIISGYGRSVQAGDGSGGSVESLDDLFQTDAAINEGNSGGPLVNVAGEVIGVNTAIASNSQNVGFAIPINDVQGLIESVKKTGKLQRPYLGVIYISLTNDIAKEFSLSTKRGAYIPKTSDMGSETIIAGGPASKSGLQEGDVISKIDDEIIDEKTSLVSVLGKRKVGEEVKLTVIRGEDTITLSVKLGASPTE